MKAKKSKRSLLSILAPMLLFVAGAGIFLYPTISNLLAERNHSNVIRHYQTSLSDKRQEELDDLWKEALTYNENLAGDPVHDPFVRGSGYVLPEDYENVLNINGDGVMGYLEISKIDVNLPIYHGTGEKELEKGAGHLEGTSLPVGGDSRHVVMCAHRGLPSAELFTKLDKMVEGDIFLLHVLNKTLAYQVDEIQVIDPEELENLRMIEGEDLVTLMTCTPYGVNTQRLLVRGKRIEYKQEALVEEDTYIKWKGNVLIGISSGIVVISILVFCIRRKKKKHEA